MTTPIPAGWKPIESAPKNQLVMVYTPPQPSDWPDTVRIGFDYIDPEVSDDYWYNHGEHYEHYCCVAKPENCTGPQERAPYTHWMPLPAAPGSPASVAPGDAQDERQAFENAERRRAGYADDSLSRAGQYEPSDEYLLPLVQARWAGWQARSSFCAPAAGDAPPVLPPLNDDLAYILGRPNFRCAALAELLRADGQEIKRKSEHEQAAVIHFLLGHYLKHGSDWRETAGSALDAIAAQQRKGGE